uniref:Myeloid leukemia factor 1 n=1 Tax=Davidia involucrata TaxID=16924 RepID=A0A5B6YTH3_DAVIN
MMSSIFGGRDPFDDPFFKRPFGSMSGSSMFGSSSPFGDSTQISRSKGPVIEELHTDDDEEEGDAKGAGEKKDKGQKNTGSNKDPFVEHPDDQADEREGKDAPYKTDYNKLEGMQPETRSASFRKVTYGGINGAYYTATKTRMTGNDGLVLEESRQADRTTGQAAHRISRGIHDKGHSVTRKLNSDGKVDTMQMLHNLSEDELAGFELAWKGNDGGHFPGWNDEFNFHGTAGDRNWGGWALPFREFTGRAGGMRPDNESKTCSSGGRPKKVVTINIE